MTLEVPDIVHDIAYQPNLPDDWATLSRDPESTARIGQAWLETGAQLAMHVPSVVCPTDFDLLLNPQHADFASSVKVIGKEAFALDPRLFGQIVLTLSKTFDDQGEVDKRGEHHIELVEARKDATKTLQASE